MKYKQATFSRSLIAGFLCGFLTALAAMLYSLIYREITGLETLSVLSPVPIYIAIPLLFLIFAMIYYVMITYLHRGELLFIMLFAIITIAAIIIELIVDNGIGKLLTLPQGLITGEELLSGLSTCLLLPYLIHHPGIYFTKAQLNREKISS